MKRIILTCSLIILVLIAFSQTDWQLTGSTPEGGGITDLRISENSGDLFAVTASTNSWPGGDHGGIKRSSDDGDTWINIFDAYVGRTINEGSDGSLYASVWPYPDNEGLYRSSNNGDEWELLITVPEGNNIFSTVVKESTPNNIIFAGTRTGVYRSLDNGTTWNYTNTGIPTNSWVRSMEVGPNGTIAAGTTNGLFVSFNNGDNWSKVEGEYENETIVSLMFETTSSSKDDEVNLYAGTANGHLLLTTFLVAYAVATLVHNFNGQMELTKMKLFVITTAVVYSYYMLSIYSAAGGNFHLSYPGINNWQQFTTGLPSIPISMFAAVLTSSYILHMFIGLYGNANGGAKVYKSSSDVLSAYEQIPYANKGGLQLMQNFPNPFSKSTFIGFNLEKSGQTLLELYDWSGRKIRTIIDEYKTFGPHHVNLTGTGLTSGMYYYTLQSGQISLTKKLIVQ